MFIFIHVLFAQYTFRHTEYVSQAHHSLLQFCMPLESRLDQFACNDLQKIIVIITVENIGPIAYVYSLYLIFRYYI